MLIFIIKKWTYYSVLHFPDNCIIMLSGFVCMRVNPDKPQFTAFHLRNKEAKRMLKVKWNRTDLENTPHPKYLCVTLDRTLSYKQHIHKMKVATRNNLLRKLSSSKWGTNASTIRTTSLVLSYFVAEYTALVWARSAHAYKLDSELTQISPVFISRLYGLVLCLVLL